MAEEPIVFPVTDGGTTADFVRLLEALAAAGEATFANLTDAVGGYVEGSAAAVAAQQLMNTYIAAGGTQIAEVGALLSNLTAAQVEYAASSGDVITALQTMGVEQQSYAVRVKQTIDAVYAEADAQLAAAAKMSEAVHAEDEAYSIHASFIKEAAFSVAVAINAAKDLEVGSVAQVAAATKAAAAEVSTSFAAMKESSSFLSGAAGQLGLFFTAAAALKDINISDRMQTQLISVTGSAGAANAAYTKLYKTAQDTGQPIEATTKLFAQLDSVLKGQGYTTDQVAKQTDNLAKILRGTGIAGEATGRVFHEVQEILSGSANSQRAWNSIYAQAPAFAEKFAQAVGYDLAAAHNKNNDALAKAQTALSNYNQKQADGNVSVQGAASRVQTLNSELGNLATRHAIATQGVTQTTKQTQLYNAEVARLKGEIGGANVVLDQATAAEYRTVSAKRASLEAKVKDAQQTKDNVFATNLLKDAATNEANSANAQAEAHVTLTESFNRLNNSFLNYLQVSGDAGIVSQVFATVLGVVGSNMNIIIPVALLLGAAFAVMKIASLATDFIGLASSLIKYAGIVGTSAIATAALDFAMTPLGIAILVIGAGLALVLGRMGAFNGALATLKDVAKAAGEAIFGSSAYADTLNTRVAAATPTVQDLAKSMGQGDGTTGNPGLTGALSGSNGLTAGLTGATTALDAGGKALGAYGDAAAHTMAQLQALVGAQSLVNNNAQNNSSRNGSYDPNAAYAKDYDGSAARYASYSKAASQAGLGQGGQFGEQGFKAGGTVAGSSGTDTKTIKVSPGEHVTIQTPEQFYNGKINTASPVNDNHFAAGGTTGYNSLQDSDYYTSGAAPSADTSAAAVMTPDAAVTTAKLGPADPRASGADNTSAGTTTDPSTSTQATPAQARAKQAAIDADLAALHSAQQVTTIDGQSKPTSNLMTEGQAKKWININGAFVGRAGNIPGITNVSNTAVAAAYKQFSDDTRKPAYNFRDGGDVTIGGSGGVDSQVIRMAVSPGEIASIRTPQQVQAAERNAQRGSNGGNVTFNIQTKDANSFGQSQAQILNAAKQKLRRVG